MSTRTRFVADPDLDEWIRGTFIAEGGPLHNPDHSHLEHARIGALWTDAPSRRRGKVVAAAMEIPRSQGGGWGKERQLSQFRDWFGGLPDFVLTLSAPICAELDEPKFLRSSRARVVPCCQREGQA